MLFDMESWDLGFGILFWMNEMMIEATGWFTCDGLIDT